MSPEFEVTTEELNQSYVAITSRAKGPPSITVKVVNSDPRTAGKEASDIFNELTRYYRERWEQEQPTPTDAVAGGPALHPDYDPETAA